MSSYLEGNYPDQTWGQGLPGFFKESSVKPSLSNDAFLIPRANIAIPQIVTRSTVGSEYNRGFIDQPVKRTQTIRNAIENPSTYIKRLHAHDLTSGTGGIDNLSNMHRFGHPLPVSNGEDFVDTEYWAKIMPMTKNDPLSAGYATKVLGPNGEALAATMQQDRIRQYAKEKFSREYQSKLKHDEEDKAKKLNEVHKAAMTTATHVANLMEPLLPIANAVKTEMDEKQRRIREDEEERARTRMEIAEEERQARMNGRHFDPHGYYSGGGGGGGGGDDEKDDEDGGGGGGGGGGRYMEKPKEVQFEGEEDEDEEEDNPHSTDSSLSIMFNKNSTPRSERLDSGFIIHFRKGNKGTPYQNMVSHRGDVMSDLEFMTIIDKINKRWREKNMGSSSVDEDEGKEEGDGEEGGEEGGGKEGDGEEVGIEEGGAEEEGPSAAAAASINASNVASAVDETTTSNAVHAAASETTSTNPTSIPNARSENAGLGLSTGIAQVMSATSTATANVYAQWMSATQRFNYGYGFGTSVTGTNAAQPPDPSDPRVKQLNNESLDPSEITGVASTAKPPEIRPGVDVAGVKASNIATMGILLNTAKASGADGNTTMTKETADTFKKYPEYKTTIEYMSQEQHQRREKKLSKRRSDGEYATKDEMIDYRLNRDEIGAKMSAKAQIAARTSERISKLDRKQKIQWQMAKKSQNKEY